MADDSGDTETAMQSRVPAMNGPATAAILLMLLDDGDAASILRHFDPDEVKCLGSAMFSAAEASESEITAALSTFIGQCRSVSSFAAHAEPRIRSVMTEALGNVRADNILAAIAPQTSANLLEMIRWMEPQTIKKILGSEHPQVGALILAVLKPQIAATILEQIDEAAQTDLVYRAARLTKVSGSAIEDLEHTLARYLDDAGSNALVTIGGKSEIAKIVNNMNRTNSDKILQSVKQMDEQLGRDIEDEMFIFDNLLELNSKSISEVARSVDSDTLGLALKGASQQLQSHLLNAMSARAADTIRDEMEERGPVKRSEVETAQKSVISAVRRLAEDGTIQLGSGGEDYV